MSDEGDDRLQELQDLKGLLEAQRDVISAQKDLLESQKGLVSAALPAIPAGKEGLLTFKNENAHPFHARVKVYEALQLAVGELAKEIKKEVQEPNRKQVTLASREDITAAGQYQVALLELNYLTEAFEKVPLPPDEREAQTKQGIVDPGTLAVGASVALGMILDLTKLFRADRTVYLETTNVESADLFDLLVTRLAGIEIKYPAAEVDAVIAGGVSEFVNRLKKLNDLRGIVDRHILKIEALPKKERDQAASLAGLRALASRHDKFSAFLATVDKGSGTANLFHVVRGERVALAMNDENKALLTARIAQQGGVSVIESRATGVDRLLVSGGVVISYRLAVKGAIRAAGTIAKEAEAEAKDFKLK